jgi:hypothetical protein
MLTPGRCKKRRSGLCAMEAVWGVMALAATCEEAWSVSEAETDAPGDDTATVGAGCTQVSDDDSALGGEANFDQFPACSDAEAVHGGVVGIAVIIAPHDIFLMPVSVEHSPLAEMFGNRNGAGGAYSERVLLRQ